VRLAISELESARFGYRVSRLDLALGQGGDLVAAVRESGFDVVIVRARADDFSLPARLASVPAYRAIAADSLIWWGWRDDGSVLAPLKSGHMARPVEGHVELEHMVREVFADYRNHYSANPLFGSGEALDGYCEWARLLFDSGDARCTVLSDDAGPAGFGLVDLSSEIPNIRLAGIVPRARRGGRYHALMTALMLLCRAAGASEMRISTQSNNTRVMRAWARLGWLPRETFVTTHLVREDLLALGR
jgi:hypothetical protein